MRLVEAWLGRLKWLVEASLGRLLGVTIDGPFGRCAREAGGGMARLAPRRGARRRCWRGRSSRRSASWSQEAGGGIARPAPQSGTRRSCWALRSRDWWRHDSAGSSAWRSGPGSAQPNVAALGLLVSRGWWKHASACFSAWRSTSLLGAALKRLVEACLGRLLVMALGVVVGAADRRGARPPGLKRLVQAWLQRLSAWRSASRSALRS